MITGAEKLRPREGTGCVVTFTKRNMAVFFPQGQNLDWFSGAVLTLQLQRTSRPLLID